MFSSDAAATLQGRRGSSLSVAARSGSKPAEVGTYCLRNPFAKSASIMSNPDLLVVQSTRVSTPPRVRSSVTTVPTTVSVTTVPVAVPTIVVEEPAPPPVVVETVETVRTIETIQPPPPPPTIVVPVVPVVEVVPVVPVIPVVPVVTTPVVTTRAASLTTVTESVSVPTMLMF
ncbi:hypothetical protein V5799_032525 [Amblyomma americanum]|uniref:Uncharacterized protein n=1 Tax=Amblyomma americanum TaxID=6943 RepID=A0AAQ4DQX5_AMBAM